MVASSDAYRATVLALAVTKGYPNLVFSPDGSGSATIHSGPTAPSEGLSVWSYSGGWAEFVGCAQIGALAEAEKRLNEMA